jgi:acyl-CoA synthetase (AMP-forming)/AMP-acid ligase II
MSLAGLRLEECVLGQVGRALDDPLLTFAGYEPWTGRMLVRRIEEVRGFLSHIGLSAGDRVALCCGNHPDVIATWLAVNSLSGTAVLMNGSISRAVAQRQLALTTPRAVLVDEGTSGACAGDPTLTQLPCGAPIKAEPLPLSMPQSRPMRGELESSAIRLSSGTTGAPKGLVLSHRSMVLTVLEEALEVGIRPRDRVLVALPLQGAGGWFTLAGLTMTANVTVLVDPRSLANTDLHSFSHLVTVPELLRRTPVPSDRSESGASLQVVTTGAPLEAGLRQSWIEAGAVLWDLYGSTETEVMTSRRPWEATSHPFFNSEVRTGSGRAYAGPIEKRGPDVFSGVLSHESPMIIRPPRSGWVRSGDVGRHQPVLGGALHVEGRADDVMVINGNNVNPGELESVLAEEAGWHGVAFTSEVIHGTEEIVAYVSDSVSLEEVDNACRRYLPRNSRPHRFRRVQELPRNEFGKLQRHQLRLLSVDLEMAPGEIPTASGAKARVHS